MHPVPARTSWAAPEPFTIPLGDTAAVPGITTSALRIDELMTLLVEHGVGPASLRDVVDDWL